jgi:hypothetical protein
MRVLFSLCFALFVSSFFFSSCSNSHQIACPDYTKDPRFKTSAQAYKQTKYKPLKVDNKYKMKRVRTTPTQNATTNIQAVNSEVNKVQTIQMPVLTNILQPINQPVINSQLDKAISPDIGLYSGEMSVSSMDENSGFEELKLSAKNDVDNTSIVIEQSETSTIERSKIEEVDDVVAAPPLVFKNRKERRQFLREVRSTMKDYIAPQAEGEVKDVTGFAVAALVLGIVSLFFFPFIAGPLAIIFGGMALKRANANPNQEGRGLAVAGLVCGIIGTLGGLVVLLLI